jgi:hypothetical protein
MGIEKLIDGTRHCDIDAVVQKVDSNLLGAPLPRR